MQRSKTLMGVTANAESVLNPESSSQEVNVNLADDTPFIFDLKQMEVIDVIRAKQIGFNQAGARHAPSNMDKTDLSLISFP